MPGSRSLWKDEALAVRRPVAFAGAAALDGQRRIRDRNIGPTPQLRQSRFKSRTSAASVYTIGSKGPGNCVVPIMASTTSLATAVALFARIHASRADWLIVVGGCPHRLR